MNLKSTVNFRKAATADITLLTALSQQTFKQAFGAANTPENIAAFLASAYNPEQITYELLEPANTFYITEIAGKPAGYLKLRWPAPDQRIPYSNNLQICRLYLLQEFWGWGLGDQLMQFCLEKAREMSCEAVWLTVWEHNPRAISFYQKWGFTQVSTDEFVLGNEVQLDYLLIKAI